MPIAKTKQELLDAIETEYRLLKKCIAGLGVEERELPGVCHEWSAKDVLAHLVEWKKMFLGWYEEGLRGGNPRTPAEDLKWTETPALNDRIYRKWKDEKYEVILASSNRLTRRCSRSRAPFPRRSSSASNSIPGCAYGRWRGGLRLKQAAIIVGRGPAFGDGRTAANCNQLTCRSLTTAFAYSSLPAAKSRISPRSAARNS
jgi:hypothetical protein